MSNQQRFVRTSKGIIDINQIVFVTEDDYTDEFNFYLIGKGSVVVSLPKVEGEMFIKLYLPISGDTTVLKF